MSLGFDFDHVASERKAMTAMMRLATTPAADGGVSLILKMIQQIEARAAKTKPSFLWIPSRCMERNMKTAAAQSRPSCARKKLWIDSGIAEMIGANRKDW